MDLRCAVAFLSELQKIAFVDSHMDITKSREGRRPISVSKLLDKDKAGELYKKGDAQGNPQDTAAGSVDDPGAAKIKRRPGEGPSQGSMIPLEQKYGSLRKTALVQGGVFSEGPSPIPTGESPNMSPESKKPRKKGDVPSQDDSNAVDRYDQRENATTVTGLGQSSSDIGTSNHPGEHA